MSSRKKSIVLSVMDRGTDVLKALLEGIQEAGGEGELELIRIISDEELKERVGRCFAEKDPNADLLEEYGYRGWKTVTVEGAMPISEEEFGQMEFDFNPFCGGAISTNEMIQKAKEMNAFWGPSMARLLLADQGKIPAPLRGNNCIVIPGFRVLSPDGYLYLAFLRWDGEQWILNFDGVEYDWFPFDRLVCPRNN